ncbi:MAG TPA: DUF6295 family protein [Natronosporangium sp.]
MCTTISHRTTVTGCGKGPQGWFDLHHVNVGYDHPFRAPFEHAVSIDFLDEGSSTRVAVELSRESARELAKQILATVDEADAYEGEPARAGS